MLSVPLGFSDANFCSLNLNRLKIIDDILNRLKCQNVKWQKHITDRGANKKTLHINALNRSLFQTRS